MSADPDSNSGETIIEVQIKETSPSLLQPPTIGDMFPRLCWLYPEALFEPRNENVHFVSEFWDKVKQLGVSGYLGDESVETVADLLLRWNHQHEAHCGLKLRDYNPIAEVYRFCRSTKNTPDAFFHCRMMAPIDLPTIASLMSVARPFWHDIVVFSVADLMTRRYWWI